jgi:tRNA (guanine-N7-)-methyltransferase
MRLRNKPGAKEQILSYPQYVIPNPDQYKGNWSKIFGNQSPIHIEVGTGKGQFITRMALENPMINYIGIELYDNAIVAALDHVIMVDLPNVKLLNVDANHLTEYFADSDVERVYLNFSDPWPKNRHEKRRLTNKTFLKVYEEILIPGGEIHFKTDNQSLFEYSLISFSEYDLILKYINLDLHHSDFEGNIMTEYEEKFSKKGNRIYRTEVKYKNGK